jgi:hypothetical protein
MTVYQVIAQIIIPAVILKAPDEIREVGIYGQLVHFPILPRPEVNEAGILAQFIYHLVHRVVDPGVHIYLMSQLAQLTRHLQDIYAHATGISGAQSAYRAAVRAEHGNSERFAV